MSPLAVHSARERLAPWSRGSKEFDRRAAAHLARRALLGAGPDRIGELIELGPREAAASLVRDARAAAEDPKGVSVEALGTPEALRAHWMARLLAPDGTAAGRGRLIERLALSWHNHFATSVQKVEDAVLVARQIQTLREQSRGNLRDLLGAMVQDGAMLVWLDGDGSRPPKPNENLARELLELFALGRGHYSESDVKECARALTGWSVRGRKVLFTRSDHDGGQKQVLGTQAAFGARELTEHLSHSPHFPEHMARRLVRELVADGGDEAVEGALAAELRARDLDILSTVEALLGSEVFYAPRFRGAKLAGPVEYLARCTLALGVSLPPVEAARLASRAGQTLLAPPTVEGWRGGEDWAHGPFLLARREAAWALAQRAISSPSLSRGNGVDVLAIWQRLHPGDEAPRWLDALDALGSDGDRREREARRVLELLDAPATHRI